MQDILNMYKNMYIQEKTNGEQWKIIASVFIATSLMELIVIVSIVRGAAQ